MLNDLAKAMKALDGKKWRQLLALACSKDEGQEHGHFECNCGISKLFQKENASVDA